MSGQPLFTKLYMQLFPTVFAGTSMLGAFTWLSCDRDAKTNKSTYFTSAVQYATVSIVTAVTFPVSFPLITLYAFKNDLSNIENNADDRTPKCDKW
jgi:hypothetical protein